MNLKVERHCCSSVRNSFICLLAITISGCASVVPKHPIPQQFVDQTKLATEQRLSVAFRLGENAVQPMQIDDAQLLQWWAKFEDPLLNLYVERAIAESQDVVIALARLDQARASMARASADLSPTLDLGGSAT